MKKNRAYNATFIPEEASCTRRLTKKRLIFGSDTVDGTSEQKTIELCIKGDRSAQKALFDLLAPRMYPVCIRYVGDREVAQDILQDGFVTLYSKLGSFKGEGSFDGWGRRIFINTALMYLRKKDALKMSDELENARHLSSDIAGQMEDIGYKELMRLVTSLPPGFRTVFNMYVIEGYSHKEIAEILGITETTSRTQLSKSEGG